MRRILKCLLAALWIMMVLMLPTAQADDGLAWMDELCPADEDGVHSIEWDDVPGDCTHEWISTVYCSKCGKSHTERDPAPGHQWDDGKVTKEPTCTEPGERTYTCTRLLTNIGCGETRTETIPALGHDWDSGTVTTAATCTTDGVKTYTCSRCGTTKTETIPATGHTAVSLPAVAATCTTGGKTEGSKCSVCGTILAAQADTAALGHSWDGGAVTTAATCTAAGVKTYTCSRCGTTKTETIPATGHTAVSIPAVAATCTTGGKTEGSQCSVCGAILTAQTDTAALGHSWDSGAVTTAATCTAAGVKTYTCSRCGTTKTETIPATGHTAVSLPAVAATCTTGGKTEGSQCSVCGAILTAQTDTAALGHDYQETDSKAATATEDGYKKYSCSRCGDSYTETISKTPHEHTYAVTAETPATCTADGSRTYSCTICGNTKSETIPATGHSPETIPAVAATCTATGKSEGSRCSVCGTILTAQTDTAALGHDYRLTDSKDATATEDGYKTYTCSRCGDSYTEILSKTPHEHIYAVTAETPATCTSDGSRTYSCSICGATYSETILATGHNWGAWVTVKNPTATEDGLMERVCGNDASHKEQQAIPATGSLPLTTADEKDDGIKPSLLFAVSWAPDAGAGKRYVGAIVNVDETLTNTGNCDLYLPNMDGLGDSIDAPHPKGDGERSDCYRLAPGESLTVHNFHHSVLESDVEKGALYRNGFLNTYSAYYMNENGNTERIYSNTFEENIPLTYPDGVTPEEKKPQLTLNFLYDDPAKDVYDPDDSVFAWHSLANTGNVPLYVVLYATLDGIGDDVRGYGNYDPGESTKDGLGLYVVKKGIAPGTETEDLLGTVTMHFYYVGFDPDTGEELCRSETITRTWKVGKPGFTPWPIPEESDIYGKLTTGASASSAGYQLGALYIVMLEIQNTGKVTIPADGITFSDPSNGQTYSVFSNDFKPGESGIAFGWLHLITEEDVKNGYIYYPPVQLTWTDPDSGNPRTVYTNSLTLTVSSSTGLLLTKDISNGPENGSYYREGETIPWTLTVMNNSEEPVRNVTVTDQGVTVGTFQEIAAGETVTCNVPPYVVTEYDAFAGKVSNYATATGEDLRGTVHTWNSNTVTAPTNQFADPLPPKDGKTGEPKEDPGDPMGAAYGLHADASVRKEEDGGPMNGSYYELDEEIHFTIMVKNTGDTPLENVSVADSLNGFAPIGTAASIAPGAEVPFTFTHQVTQPDIDAGWVTNSATVTYTFDGGKPGTPVQSNPVNVKAGDSNGLNTGSGGGHFTPIPPATPSGDPLEPVKLPDGTPLTTPDGKPIIAPPGTVPVIGPDGKPVTAPGGVYTGPDGKPVSIPAGTPVLMLPDGTYCVISSDGRAILTDANGNPILDENGFGHYTPILSATPSGDPLEPVTLPDGTPLTTPDGKPIIAPPGTVPVIGPDGKPVTAPGGVYTGPDGKPVSIPAGTPVLMLPDGTYCVISSDGRAILTDANGNPILDENGFVIFPGWSIGSASCELRLDGLGENEANYTLHACADHTEAAYNAEEAGKAGDWAGAARIWREEVEEMYGIFFEAADDEGKAALVQEHAAFFAYADAWQALAGDEAAAELLRLKAAKMCCVIHTLPDELPDSIVGAIEILNGETHEATLREIGALNGSDSAVTETYAGAAARTLKDIRSMLAGTKSYNYGDVFERGQRSWQIALDNTVNTVYKAADKETRKLIIAWRTALDTLYEAEKPLLEMLYPDNDTTVWEELMNLYKDRVFDSAKIQ